ncbi:MAG TPA: glycosyltransferase 61 family protein [Herbaspirillum sp.]
MPAQTRIKADDNKKRALGEEQSQNEEYMTTWFSRKTRILIFGTGAGGVSFYQRARSRYKVVGFLDNNRQKQGQALFGKVIYAPQTIDQLLFDKIIIVSDYYREIYQQLIGELAVSEQKVSVFQQASQEPSSAWQRWRKRLELIAYEWMCRRRGAVASLLFWLLFDRHGSQQEAKIRLLPLRWLDEANAFRVHVFRPAIAGTVQGPRFIVRPSPAKTVTLPTIALYQFHQARVCSVSRAVMLADGEVVIERVPTAPSADADYTGAHLVYHGKELALVRSGPSEQIEKGILISGCNEVNYYHWVVEILPQLQFIAELPDRYADYPILMSGFGQKIPSVKILIESLGIERQVISLSNISSYQVADLLLISAPNNFVPNQKGSAWRAAEDSFARPESIAYLRDSTRPLASLVPISSLPKRVLLARKGILRQYNQDEIISVLEPYGFTPVYMEELDLNHQIALMANADIILGPTGAAWTNILFASKGCKALCWMAEEWGELSCFSNLAAIVGVDMDYLTYRAGTADSRELYYQQYRVDTDRIADWLAQYAPLATHEEAP